MVSRELTPHPNAHQGESDPYGSSLADGSRRGLVFEERTVLMAILNITPDSFSDGGRFLKEGQKTDIIKEAKKMLDAGADILDVGGESTRPGAEDVSIEEELVRVIPVIETLSYAYPESFISIDTRKAEVARAALTAGARMVNDVSGLQYDGEAMANTVADADAWLVIMHSQGTPQTMQTNPTYKNVVEDVKDFFQKQITLALDCGVKRERILIDPGFGFGKTLEHNLTLLQNLDAFHSLGYPLLVGTSRKAFLTLGHPEAIPPLEREALTSASLALAISRGAAAVRVHDLVAQGPVVRFLDSACKGRVPSV